MTRTCAPPGGHSDRVPDGEPQDPRVPGRQDYATVGQLAAASDQELLDVRGIGPVALHEILGALAAAGYPRGGAR